MVKKQKNVELDPWDEPVQLASKYQRIIEGLNRLKRIEKDTERIMREIRKGRKNETNKGN